MWPLLGKFTSSNNAVIVSCLTLAISGFVLAVTCALAQRMLLIALRWLTTVAVYLCYGIGNTTIQCETKAVLWYVVVC